MNELEVSSKNTRAGPIHSSLDRNLTPFCDNRCEEYQDMYAVWTHKMH